MYDHLETCSTVCVGLLSVRNNLWSIGYPSSNFSYSQWPAPRRIFCVCVLALCAPVQSMSHNRVPLTHTSAGQDFLESTFPASKTVPSSEAIKSASGSNDKELDREAREGRLVETKLDVPNTIIKFVLDQTIGAAFNTLMFSFFTHSIKQAMAHRALITESSDLAFLASGKAIDYSQVDWRLVLEQAKIEFYPIMKAGLSLWPMVSLFNFVVVKSVEGRNLVGSLAGVVWGVYMSLVAAG